MKRTTRRRVSSIDYAKDHGTDPVTVYAKAVTSRTIVAAPLVRKACERHMRDLEEGPSRGLKWSLEKAHHAFDYFGNVLRLNGGQFEGLPFHLRLWQSFIVGSLFGWIGPDGFRRFRTAFIEIAKGNGKSPLAAGIGLYGLTSDGESRAEIYAAAAKKDQAMILFRDAVAMRDQSPHLSRRLIKYGGLHVWNMIFPQTNSFFRAISSEDSQSGPRPHMALCDEIHEHPNADVIDMLHAGLKFRRQPLIVEITNSGVDRNSVCFEHHLYSRRILQQERDDDAWFCFVCGIDRGDKWRSDESIWPKANPNLGVSIELKYLREAVKKAEGMPTTASKVQRLNFCIWTDAATPWIDGDKWDACEAPDLDLAQYRGSRCWGGLDLSQRTDLTALALAFRRPDGLDGIDMFVFFWAPEEGLKEREERDKVPYTLWRDEGYLEVTPGGTVDYEYVARRMIDFVDSYGLAACAFDRWKIADLERELEEAQQPFSSLGMEPTSVELQKAQGLILAQHGQGFKDMTPAVEHITELVTNGKLRVKSNPIMTMCSANAVIRTGPADEKKFDKRKSTGRIDGLIAATMAARCAQVYSAAKGGTIYDTQDLMLV